MLSKLVKCGIACMAVGALGISLYLWHLHSTPVQEGVLATVNGQPITAQRVQLYVDMRHPLGPESSFDDMRKANADALGSLVVTRLMEQALQTADLLPDATTLDANSKKMLEEYPPQELGALFSEIALNEAEWLAFMRDTQIATIFEREVLQKRMRINLPAVRDIYEGGKEAFAMPDTFRLCSVRSTDKADVEGFCARLGKGNATTGDIGTPAPACLTVNRKELPDALQALAKKDRTNTCTKVEQIDDFWQAAWLARADRGGLLSLPEAYAMIETMLRESEKYTTFAAWLEEAVARADIRLAPEIAPEMLNLQNSEKRLSNPVTKKSDAKQGK